MQNQRVTPDELRTKLLQYHKAKSVPMTEAELVTEIDKSALPRYKVGDKLLSEVQDTLRKLSNELPEGEARNEAVFAISKIDEAAQEIVYCALNLNKGLPFVKPALGQNSVGIKQDHPAG